MKKVDLKTLREQLRLTQAELAEKLGLARTYISMIESGAKPFSEKLRTKVEGLLLSNVSARDINASGNAGVMAIGSPGAQLEQQVVNNDKREEPKWVRELRGELSCMREQLGHIQALLIQLVSKS